MSEYVIGVISDTHNKLGKKALKALRGSDLIVHAGDICRQSILDELTVLAPTIAVRGNNDFPYAFEEDLPITARFTRCGTEFEVVHKAKDALPYDTDIVIVGHTHKASIKKHDGVIILNPGSASRPRDGRGPSVARITLRQGRKPSVTLTFLSEC